MKKKVISFLIVILLIISIAPTSMAIVNPTITVGSASVLLGNQVTIPITIDQIPANWTSIQLEIQYDTSKLTYVSGVNGNIFSGTPQINGTIAGSVKYVTSVASAVTTGSKICEFTFTANESATLGNTAITVNTTFTKLEDINADEIAYNSVNGTITITIDQASALAIVNATTDATTMIGAMQTYATELELDFTAYNALGATYKTAVNTSVFNGGTDYASATALETAFNSAVATQAANQANAEALATAIAAVNNATTTGNMLTALQNTALGINFTTYNGLASSDQTTVLGVMVAGRPYANEQAIGTTFNNAVNAISSAIAAVNNATTTTNVLTALQDTDLGISFTAYNQLAASDQAKVLGVMIAGTYQSTDAIVTAFNGAVNAISSAIAAVNNATATANVLTALQDTDLEINFTTYNGLAATDQATVLGVMVAGTYESTDAIVTAFNGATNAISGAIAAVNNATTTTNVLTALQDSDLGINFTTYNTLINKDAVLTVMINGTYNSVQAINTAFNEAVIAQQALEVSVTLSGSVTALDGYLKNGATASATFTIKGVSKTVNLVFNASGVATFSETFGTLINAADNSILSVSIDGYRGGVVIAQTIADKGTYAIPGSIQMTPGDVNGDGAINLLDVSAIASMFNAEAVTDNAYDLNDDTLVNVQDLYYIGKYFDQQPK